MPAQTAGKATPEPRSMPRSQTTSDATTVVLAEPSPPSSQGTEDVTCTPVAEQSSWETLQPDCLDGCKGSAHGRLHSKGHHPRCRHYRQPPTTCVAVEAQPAPCASPTRPRSSALNLDREKRQPSSAEIERQMLATVLKQVQQTSIKSSKPWASTVNRSKLCRLLLGAALMTTAGVWALTVTRELGPDESPTCQLTDSDSSWSTTSIKEIEAAALIADDWRYLLKMTRAYGIICLTGSGLHLLGAVLVLCGCLGSDDSAEDLCCGCLQAIVGIFMLVYVIIFLVAFGEISDSCEGHQDFEAVSSIHTYVMVVNIIIPASVLALCCCLGVVACALSVIGEKRKVLPFKP